MSAPKAPHVCCKSAKGEKSNNPKMKNWKKKHLESLSKNKLVLASVHFVHFTLQIIERDELFHLFQFQNQFQFQTWFQFQN
jgi:hypothetical protein